MQKKMRIEDFLPQEYKTVTTDILRNGAGLEEFGVYAKMLGVEADYKKNLYSREDLELLLQAFQRNALLLIAKTWVEKGDEILKEKLAARIKRFIREFELEDYNKALNEFAKILEEFAFLFFGEQSKKSDLIEYAFRIDIQLGLFCWYGKNLLSIAAKLSSESLRAFLIIGICYITRL
ncbi:MAG: hypothetical protein LBG79_03835 [Spirochaetaceae bacterium]|jgi:hypothetical protein|nr:hypothetical protein [Spirochaetaceae bacterium]